ncbi:hypothetical protein HKX48_008767, partial [Thoreauomyces humboldtii]
SHTTLAAGPAPLPLLLHFVVPMDVDEERKAFEERRVTEGFLPGEYIFGTLHKKKKAYSVGTEENRNCKVLVKRTWVLGMTVQEGSGSNMQA